MRGYRERGHDTPFDAATTRCIITSEGGAKVVLRPLMRRRGPPPPLRMLRPHYHPPRGARRGVYTQVLRRELQPARAAPGGAGRPGGPCTQSQLADGRLR